MHVSGNWSTAITAYVEHLATRETLIRQAILDLAATIEPDGAADPADDNRAEAPHQLLSALLDESAARAIGHALNDLWLRWQMPAKES